MAYRILAFDLDGTLTNSQKKISPRTLTAIRKAQEKGITIVLASGRPTQGIAPLADELELDTKGGFVLSYNGGQIIDWKTREVTFQQSLTLSQIERCYYFAKAFDQPIISYRDDHIISESPMDEWLDEECRINGMPLVHVDNFVESIAALPTLPTKCLMTGEPQRMERIAKLMAEELRGTMEAFRSAPFFIELVPLNIDKAQSLQRLLSSLNLRREELMAFGDGFNDLSMLQFAGMGVAMENADAEVKAAADLVTLSNDADGIAHVIENVIFAQE